MMMTQLCKKFLMLVFLLAGGGLMYAQTNKTLVVDSDLAAQKNPITEFNNKRKQLSGGQEQNIYFYKEMKENDFSLVLDYLDKLDDKIIHVAYTADNKGLKINYSINVEMIDIMQGLRSINYPAYYITSNGSQAAIDVHGKMETVEMTK